MKPIKFAVAIALTNPDNPEEILTVLRPPNAKSLPNIWGLPAVSLKEGESVEDAITRIGKEKLSTTITPESFIGVDTDERPEHQLVLIDIKANLSGPQPSVRNAPTPDTKYANQKWTSDFTILIPGAQKGSVCDRVFLKSKGIDWNKTS